MNKNGQIFSRSTYANTRKYIALVLCWIWPVSSAVAQQESIEPVRPTAPILWRPYLAPEVPPARTANSGRLRDLIRAGKLYLTARDAIALALENNIDIEVSRYSPILSAWRVERAEAGGALPGVPSGASQTFSVASGQGVLGSQQAAGVSISGSNGAARTLSNTSITQVGPTTQTLDPTIQEGTIFSHRTLPQPNVVQSITQVLIQNQRIYTGSLQEGFLSGGAVSLTYNNHFLNENAPSDLLNPSEAPNLVVSVQHNLLQGFGVAVNARTINVAKLNLQTSDLNFKTQVIATAVSVLNAYYSLVVDYEALKAKKSAAQVAQTFLEDTNKQVQIGTLADLDAIRAESQAAASQQDLVNAQTGLEQHELQLKNLISRTGVADPVVAGAQIIPIDRIAIPDSDDLPPLKELVQRALVNRSDLAAEKAGVTAAEVSALGTRNGVLPTLVVFATETQSGLSGTPRTVIGPGGVLERPDPYFVGGVGNALGQIFRRDFPSEAAGTYFSASIRNRQAQADQGIDQLQLRQTQLTTEKDLKQAQVDILNAVVALRQARVRYDAAVKGETLAQRLLDAEQKKFALGASISYNVIQQQRDLATAQSAEISALGTYSNARIALDQTLGTTLEANQIALEDARSGKVAQTSQLPAVLPSQPQR
jgi:outer membrane protein